MSETTPWKASDTVIGICNNYGKQIFDVNSTRVALIIAKDSIISEIVKAVNERDRLISELKAWVSKLDDPEPGYTIASCERQAEHTRALLEEMGEE